VAVKRHESALAVALGLSLSVLAAPRAGADQKAPAAESGWVRLPLADYDRLLRASRRRPDAAPLDAAITSTSFHLDALGASPRLSTTLELLSLSEKPQVVVLPELGVVYEAEAGLSGDGVAVSVSEGRSIELRLARRGRYTVRLSSVPSRSERGGTVVLTWSVPDSPSNRFTASLPGGHENVTLSGGSVDVTASSGGPVRVAGTLRRGEAVRLEYAVAAARTPDTLRADAPFSVSRVGAPRACCA
jgi:hypothetical protein